MKCLAVSVDASGEPGVPPVVAEYGRFNVQFKRSSAKQAAAVATTTLTDAVTAELPRLGSIVFSLVGRVGPDEPAEVPFAIDDWEVLAYDPSQVQLTLVTEPKVTVNRLDDIDVVWNAVRGALAERGDGPFDSLAERFEPAFHSLQEEAKRPVDLGDVAHDAESILSRVTERIAEQVGRYESALKSHRQRPDDAEAYNELLRVAYNFADGAATFINLIVGICDLKPPLFWLTVAEQVDLAERFKALPYALVGTAKPSLERYRTVISNARNQAFHDLFAFERAFRRGSPGCRASEGVQPRGTRLAS